MKTYPFIYLMLLLQANLFSQKFTLSGVVKDSNSALAFSSIEVLSKKKGIIADELGKFTIEMDKTDTLLVKSLGFKSKYISNFISDNVTIVLEPDTFLLSTVTVLPKNQEILEKGFTSNKAKGGYRSRPGTIIAYLIQKDNSLNNKQFLKDVSVFIANDEVVNTPIRIRCMSVSTTIVQPEKDIYKESIILKPDKGGKWYKIDLINFNIEIPENGIFICFEYFEDKPSYYVESIIKNSNGSKTKYQSYGNTLGGYWSTEPNITWHKTIGDKWFQRLEKINNEMMNLAVKYSIVY